MDETIYVILKFLFDFALDVWFSICIHHYKMEPSGKERTYKISKQQTPFHKLIENYVSYNM